MEASVGAAVSGHFAPASTSARGIVLGLDGRRPPLSGCNASKPVATPQRGGSLGTQVDEPAPMIRIPVSSITTVDVSVFGE